MEVHHANNYSAQLTLHFFSLIYGKTGFDVFENAGYGNIRQKELNTTELHPIPYLTSLQWGTDYQSIPVIGSVTNTF